MSLVFFYGFALLFAWIQSRPGRGRTGELGGEASTMEALLLRGHAKKDEFMKFRIRKSLYALVTTALLSTLSACGGRGDSPGSGDAGADPNTDPVARSLAALGVDTTETARVDDDLDALPDDYSPFGARRDFGAIRELLLLGISPSLSSDVESHMALVEMVPDQLDPDGNQVYDDEILFAPAAASTPWAVSLGAEPAALRAAARADVDGDGLEELAIVFWERSSAAIYVQLYDDQVAGFAAAEPVFSSMGQPRAIAIESGDFDGDGRADLVVAASFAAAAELFFFRNEAGTLVLDTVRKKLPQTLIDSDIDVAIATGNLDYDSGDELAVVVNEYREQDGAPPQGAARYHVIDDAGSGFADVASAQVSAVVGAGSRSAMTADVTIGDIDGDNVGELVFAGLTHFDPDGDCDYRYLLVALDDYKRELAPLGALEQDPGLGGACDPAAPLELRYVHVNAFDLDGDGYPEIQANRFVYEDFVSAPPFTAVADAELDPRSLYGYQEGYTGRFDRQNSAMITGDVTADGREDVVAYSQATHALEVWGIGEPNRAWTRQGSIPLAPLSGSEAVHPVLLAPNVNHDGLALKYDEGEYKLVFTEPIVIAALAAAPCYSDLGQDPFTCRTQFGTAESTSVQTEDSFTVTAAANVGFDLEFAVLGQKIGGLQVIGTVETHLSRMRSEAYTVTKRIAYTTGPVEDTVIFTTIPYDQYTYTILSHPDAELIGAKIVVSLPRSPIELQVSRDFYNAQIEDGGLKIDDAVFTHRAGDPHSYPGVSEKDALLAVHDGFDIGPSAVGEGGGHESLEINVHTESGSAVSWGVDFSLAVTATAGSAILGYSVGTGVDHSLRISHGKESNYVGMVSNLPRESFAANGYEFGLFTYVYEAPESGQQFEVVNYWVE